MSRESGANHTDRELIRRILTHPGPQNSDLGSLGYESGSGLTFDAPEEYWAGTRASLVGTEGTSTLQEINEYDDAAIAAVGAQLLAAAVVGEVGGAFLASSAGTSTAQYLRQMRVLYTANRRFLFGDVLRLRYSTFGGVEGRAM